MTVKAFPDFPVTGVVLQFESSNFLSPHLFVSVDQCNRHLPIYTAAGGMATAQITHASFLLTPWASLNIFYTLEFTRSPLYFRHYIKTFELNPTQLALNVQYGGRLLQLGLIHNDKSHLTDAVNSVTADGVTFVNIGISAESSETSNIWNTVLPT
ncbi:FAD-binding type 2 [Penicillium coprophilum]|uniref:FAD-binding type 2 n=1 Tax=Penicillium coprophilum TaxID=36646 RepID=UPI00239D2A29|nr:FAD-binding type 2 [Penicillium coprophilum]KAJ5169315.1 FAD-binding type 2 [Penicillium coprophilum]